MRLSNISLPLAHNACSETVLKKKFLDHLPSKSNIPAVDQSIATDDQSSPSETPSPNESQIAAFSKIVENLLFVSASSAEEYEDTSTLDERLRYIVIRCLKRKLQIEGRKRVCDTAIRAKTVKRWKSTVGISQAEFVFKVAKANVATMSR